MDYSNQQTILYNNSFLAHNIALLSSFPINDYNRLRDENTYLKNANYELENKLSNMQKIESQNQIEKNHLQNIPKIKFRSIDFRKNEKSWSDEKIRQVLHQTKSIDDIIELQNKWYEIRHNLILQRLHYLIPPLKKLNKMIGLNNIKRDVFKKIIYYIQNMFNKNIELDEYLHTVISGPPGVGKTQFAKIYADIFVRLGVLSTNNFIEIKRDDLIAEYLGQTSHRTKKLLESAMGGVLFLDEAYSLGSQEKRDSFSKEAIDMINQYLSERKNNFMFIIAGYQEDLEECFFSHNKGLKRRFHTFYHIKGYESSELYEIFLNKIYNSNYYTKISKEDLIKFFDDNKSNFKYFGGDIEKLFNEIKQQQSLRIFNDNIYNNEIIYDDITNSLNFLNTNNKPEYKVPFGMYV